MKLLVVVVVVCGLIASASAASAQPTFPLAPDAEADVDETPADTDPDGGGAASPLAPVMPEDPPADPPPSDGPDDEIPDAPQFPEGEFVYDEEHRAVWEQICGPEGWKESIHGDAEALAEWYSIQESDPNYDCGQSSRSNLSGMASATGSDVVDAQGTPIANAADCMVDQGAWNHADRKIFSAACSVAMSVLVTVTGLGLTLVKWSFSFQVADAFADVSQRLGSAFAWEMWGSGTAGASVYSLALLVTTVLLGYRAMRGQVSHAISEFALSVFLLAGFLATVVMVPNGFSAITENLVRGSSGIAAGVADITLSVADTGADGCGGSAVAIGPVGPGGVPTASDGQVFDTETLGCAIEAGLVDALVMRPYDLVNWGEDIGTDGRCADARNEILASGPHGGDDGPRFQMGAAGCEDLADYNHDPNWSRLGLALAAVLVASITLLLVIMLSVTLIMAQLMLVIAVILLPWVMIFAIVPPTRGVLWSWVTHTLRAAMMVIFVAGILSFMLLMLSVSYSATESLPWIVQAGMPIVLASMGLFLRKRIMSNTTTVAQRASSGLAAATPGSSNGGGAAPGEGTAQQFKAGSQRSAARTVAVAVAAAKMVNRDSSPQRNHHREGRQDRAARRKAYSNSP